MIGALIIDKPEGWTSHDVVARVRRIARTRRVGHAGTLDPFATGALVVCIERATRLVQFLVNLHKEYIATVRLGYATDTQDLTGEQITPFNSSNHLSIEELRRVLNEFKGAQLQLPPMYSAKKIEGQRLYRAAREGRVIEREPVPIVVHSIELVEDKVPPLVINEDNTRDFVVRVKCSSGTYVRTLAHDIGHKLGVGAHLAALRRTSVGHFNIADALTLEEAQALAEQEKLARAVISPAAMLAHLPAAYLNAEQVKLVLNGREVNLDAFDLNGLHDRMPIRLCDESGMLIAVGEYDDGLKRAKPRVVLEVSGN